MRRCLFCSARADSKEDAWPVWLQAASRPHGRVLGRMHAWLDPENIKEPLIWSGQAIKVRCVCTACNNGWMSILESAAKPIISPLVNDFSVQIGNGDQYLLALWSIKTAMVFEAVKRSGQMFFTDEDRVSLLTTFRPPLETMIWIGRHSGYAGGYGEGRLLKHAVAQPPHLASPLLEGYSNTFAFGHFVVQTLSVRRRPNTAHIRTTLDIARGDWNRLLLQVWPIRHTRITWPPALSLSDHGTTLDELSERFTADPTRL